jgi:hypothetical protein
MVPGTWFLVPKNVLWHNRENGKGKVKVTALPFLHSPLTFNLYSIPPPTHEHLTFEDRPQIMTAGKNRLSYRPCFIPRQRQRKSTEKIRDKGIDTVPVKALKT